MKPLNYYMSEVEVPTHLNLEEKLLSARSKDNGQSCRVLIHDLLTAIDFGWFRPSSYDWADQWIATQSPDTWRGLIRWLAMEVI